MLNKKLLSTLILLFLTTQLKANFDFNKNCINAYKAILDLRINDAEKLIKLEKQQRPNNGITVLLENYVDFFSLLVSENQEDYNRLKQLKSDRLSQLSKQDKSSPYYLFAQAEVNLQWGILKSRFQDYLSSGIDIKKADNLLKENESKFPSFAPNKKSSGLVKVIMGSIPSNLKGILQSFGFKGDVNQGKRQLESLVNTIGQTNYSFYRDEVIFLLCYIDTDLIPQSSSYQKTINLANSFSNSSLLKVYLQGYVSYRNAKNSEAISYLSKESEFGTDYINFPKINYLLGNAKLNRNDNDAHVFFLKYLKEYKGINFVKDAYLKLAYYYYLKNDNSTYTAYLKLVKTKGDVYDEKDKQALKEANDSPPHIDLLKARLSYDGGYYTKSLKVLEDNSINDFKLQRDQIEYYYRLGRIYDALERSNEALVNYQRTINIGKNSSYYYAANAALNIGKIFEEKKENTRAVNFYKQAINMKNHEYENSIESKAQERLKKLGAAN